MSAFDQIVAAFLAVAGLMVLQGLVSGWLRRRSERKARERGGNYAMVYTSGRDGHRAYVVDISLPVAPVVVGSVQVPEPIIGISRGIPREHREAVIALFGDYAKVGKA